MIAIAVICLIVAAAVVFAVIDGGSSQQVVFTIFAGNIVTNALWVFVAGALTGLLVVLGLSFFDRGTRRKVAQRREIKRLRKVEEQQTSQPVTAAGPTTVPVPAERAERTERAAGRREGYDEPDRQLVREPPTATAPEPPVSSAPPGADPSVDAPRHRDA